MKRILYLTDHYLTAFIVDGRRLLGRKRYSFDPDGFLEFGKDLQAAPHITTRLLVDISGEEFYEEKIPHVFSHDQKRIVARKLKQRFRGRRWVHHERQGREKSGRKDDLFLLCGITREELLEPWLEKMQTTGVPVELITSVPLLAPSLARMMGLKKGRVLFVSHAEGGGIRQTYLVDGRLKASRLAPTPPLAERDYAGQVMDEVRRMKQFLNSTYLLPFNEPLQVILLASPELVTLMGRESADTEGLRLHAYDLHGLERRFHLRAAGGDHTADLFYSQLVALQSGLPSYATPADRLRHRHYMARRWLVGAAAVALVAAVGVTAAGIRQALDSREMLQGLRQEVAGLQARRQVMRARRPAEEVSGFLMRDAVEFHQLLQPLTVSPFDYLPQIGQSLRGHPQIRLSRLETFLVRMPEEISEEERLDQYLGADNGGMEEEPEAPARQTLAVVRMSGEMAREERSYAQLHEDFNDLLAQLAARPAFERTRVETWPLEMRPDRTLELADELDDAGASLPFSLLLLGGKL